MSFRVGVDTGGTFTDAISMDEKGNVATAKEATTPKDLKQGFINVLYALAERNGLDFGQFISQVTTIVHGTTQGTNTILTKTGPKTGTLSTEGHRDVLQLRSVTRENMWDWRVPFPQPLVPRHLRVGVKERVNAQGKVLKPLD